MTPEENKKTSTSHSTTTTDESTREKVTRYFTYGPNGEKIYTPNYSNETSTTTTVAPDEQMVQYFNERVRPIVEKQHGLEFDDKGNLTTPLSRFVHFDPEKERQRREQEQKLNEWKRKEANWYNGISVLMDIATAAGGGKVGRRTPSDAAAKAVADNERLRKEQQAEDYMVEKAKQDKVAAFYKDLSDRMTALNGKVMTKQTEKPLSETIEYTPKKTVTTDTKTTTTGSLRSDKDKTRTGGERYLGYTVMVNGKPENREIPMNIGTYNKMGRDITAHYRDMYNNATGEYKKALGKILEDVIGVRVKTKGGYEWVEENAMSQGRFYKLSEEIKKEIIEKANGEIEIVEGADGYDIIQPKGTARPFVPPVAEEDEEEELMGNE